MFKMLKIHKGTLNQVPINKLLLLLSTVRKIVVTEYFGTTNIVFMTKRRHSSCKSYNKVRSEMG